MCGICGELRLDGATVPAFRVAAMRDRLVHRGPDSDGVYVSPAGRLGLGFRRLRIIDLTANASQPMPNEDGSIQVVFNGEIYNFRELRERLAAAGHTFRSRSDTEAIVHLYEEKGADCVADLDGMFALGIWDERRQQLTLARDRAGKKPLFCYRATNFLLFASEIKAFFAHPEVRAEIDPDAIPSYFVHGYVPGPSTFYRNVVQIEPGTLVVVDRTGRTAERRYWRIAYPKRDAVPRIDRGDAIAGVRARVTRAVERRLVSDVPLGAFLSGGLDSTIVVGVMSRIMSQPVKTFSIGFEGDAAYDETRYARLVADRFGTDHTEFRVAPSAVDLIDTLIWHHDGPFGDSSAVPTFIVSKLTREHVTVVLTGDGGDELFAGYRRFWAALQAERIPRLAALAADAALSVLPAPRHERHPLASAQRFFRAAARPLEERVTMWNSLFYDDLPVLLRPDGDRSMRIDRLRYLARERERMRGLSALSRLLHGNFVSYLADDLLVKTDRCTMANSLEARSPFLDRELIEYVAALPDDAKLRGRTTKAVLRDAFADLVPAPVQARAKMGFGVPVGTWFRGELRDYVRDILFARDARYREWLRGDYVERLVTRHLSGSINAGPQLWAVMCFERWLRMLPGWTVPAASAPPARTPTTSTSPA